MIKRFFRLFTQRWIVTLFGATALSLIIWYVGPLIAIAGTAPLESELIRSILIAVIFVIWGGRLASIRIKSILANKQLLAGISHSFSQSNKPNHTEDEVTQLKECFEEAVKVLGQTKGGFWQKRTSLYDLPWYVIIGPPGSGKTTALINSGLEFPLADKFGEQALQGVGGTRNCDWWFSNNAVLLDTAGRYVTQDSQAEVDNAAWIGFLDLLKKYRRRRPINGVMVTISISDLMVQSDVERKLHINAIKQRIHELYQHFGMNFPIYVLLTKSDLIAGFSEFFDDLRREERTQVWGMTFPLEEQVSGLAVESFGREFDGLLQRINERMVRRLSEERDSKRRTLIYGFPQQLAAIKDTLDLFLKDIFRPSRFDSPVMLRGVYFTSGTQEGTPIDRIMGSLARSFGLNQQAVPSFGGQNRAYFITDLLKKVVIPEAEITGKNHRLERHRIWLQNGSYIIAAGLTLLCITAWIISYNKNQSYIEDASKQVTETQAGIEALTPAHRESSLVLPLLNTIRSISTGLDSRADNPPFSMGLGLYQGKSIGAKARATYQRLLNSILLPRIILRLEEQLQIGINNPDYLFEGLKTYLMLKEQAHFDSESIQAWVSLDWEQNRPRDFTEVHLQQMNSHLSTLFNAGPPVLPMELDEQLISDTRKTLQKIPLAERAYARLKRANLNSNIPPFLVSEVGGADTATVLSRKSGQPINEGIDGFFTHKGFHEHFLPQSETLTTVMATERWIIGSDENIVDNEEAKTQLSQEVLQLYQREYIARWEAFLADIQLTPVTNINREVDILNVLSGTNSPLRKLLVAISNETMLTKSLLIGSDLINTTTEGVNSLKEKLTNVIGMSDEKEAAAERSKKPGQLVENHFAALNKLVKNREDGTAPIDGLLKDLNELFVYLDSIASADNRGQKAMDAIKGSDALSKIVSKIQVKAKRQPAFVARLMVSAASSSKNLTIGGVREHLNELWSSKPLPFCRRAINKRYPIISHASHEITLEDFGQFFGPGGIMDSFYNENLAKFVDTSTVPWRWRGEGGIKRSTLEQFRRARVIRETFFQGTGKHPEVRFQLKPINMDREITRFLLNLDGQKVTYSHGPVRLTPLQWPGPNGANQVQLQYLPSLEGATSSVRELGPWAWFRVLDSANIKSTAQPERYRIIFDMGGRKARYELHASSTYNPFRLKELSKFRCPGKL